MGPSDESLGYFRLSLTGHALRRCRPNDESLGCFPLSLTGHVCALICLPPPLPLTGHDARRALRTRSTAP
jgi:hypothetical protein